MGPYARIITHAYPQESFNKQASVHEGTGCIRIRLRGYRCSHIRIEGVPLLHICSFKFRNNNNIHFVI